TPPMSWSANNEVMAFSVFMNSSWQLFKMNVSKMNLSKIRTKAKEKSEKAERKTLVLGEAKVSEAYAGSSATDSLSSQPAYAMWLPPLPHPNEVYAQYPLAPPDSVEQTKYRSKFKLDAISFGAGFDTFYGAGGDAQFLFSDMLGNHSIYLYTQMQFNSFLHSNFGLTYLNQGGRIAYGGQAFQSNYSYAISGTFNSLSLIRNTYRGFNALLAYPFSKFSRIEITGGYTWVDQDLVEEIYTFGGIQRNDFNLTTFNYAQAGAAYVFDNTIYGPLGPYRGIRSRLAVETTNGDFIFTNLLLDHRRYFNMFTRTVLAFRLMGGSSLGRDKRIFSLGGPYTFRGSDYDAIVGPNFILTNLEYRFPLFFFLPPQFDYLSGALFYDAAAAWGIDIPGISEKKFQPFSSKGGPGLEDLRSAVGVGARLNIGYFLLQYDVAWPTDFRGFGKVVSRFSIGTFF
ncbi:MAG: hypothetical protein ACE5GL_06430, partial [Calditrichia bacterium]